MRTLAETVPSYREQLWLFGNLLLWSGGLGGLAVVCWQVLGWLRTSEWQPITVVTALQALNVWWADRPDDWFGLWQLLNYIPLVAALFVMSAIGLVIRITNSGSSHA